MMNRFARLLAATAMSFATVHEGIAHADSAAVAQSLFDDAKALMAQNKWSQACAKLEASQQLQPAGGTLMYLGICYEGAGRTATAWARFNEAMSVARRDGRADRERVAREHIGALGPKLVRLTINPADAAAAASKLVVRLDGEAVSSALFGTPVPVDPGKHVVVASAAGMKPWSGEVAVTKAGETVTLTVPALEPDAATSSAPTLPSDAAPTPPPAATKSDEANPSSTGSTQRTIAVAVGAVGVIGIGVGSVFGLQAIAKKSESDRGCFNGSSGPCSADGVSASKTAVNDGNVSTVAFSVGGAALAAGVILWLTAPKATSHPKTALRWSPSVTASSASLDLRGAF